MSHHQTDLRLPIARNDADTLRQRMTDNAYEEILPARYLRRNEAGEIIEAPDELFERVAKNIAVAEAVHTPEAVHIRPEHIKPEHPRRMDLIETVFIDDAVWGASDVRQRDGEIEFGPPWVPFDALDDVTQQDVRVPLTENNAKYVSYDALLDDVPLETQQAMEQWKGEFQSLMEHLNFTPNTPTLINAGDELQQLSACFVNSPDDDMDSIHETAREAALTFQTGGGMGYDFSALRPYGDQVGSTGGIASGPITFMETFDQVCRTIAQGGTRRGAQMGVLRVDHPDVIHFIHAKNKDVSLAHVLGLNSPRDYRNTTFSDALEEARGLITDGKVPEHLRNAAEGFLANFNISVTVTERFMDALDAGADFAMTNPRTGEPHVATEQTKDMYGWFDLGEYVEVGEPLVLPAEELWERMIAGAHENGEPGVIFIDRVNEQHSFDVAENPEYEIHATNPCSEQPLCEYEACNLGHINLSTVAAVDAPDWREWSADPDRTPDSFEADVRAFLDDAIAWDELDHRIEVGTRFLDNVVTMSDFPIPEIEERVSDMRKIGLGIMGLAQLYVQLGVEYGSTSGNVIAEQLMTHINHRAKEVSHRLADDRGSFPAWADSKYADPPAHADWFEHHVGADPAEHEDGYLLRNHNVTTIAPTGTTSMIADTSGGCEPIHSVAYFKNISNDVQGDEQLVEFDSYFLRCLDANDIDVETVMTEAEVQMRNNEFDGIAGLSTVPDRLAELFVTADDLSGKEHASVLCACQQGVDSGISKTCNFPNDASVEDVRDVYEYIYEHGGKSVTVYRDGSRSTQVVSTSVDHQRTADDASFEDWLAASEYADLEAFFDSEDFGQTVRATDMTVQYGTADTPDTVTPRERPKTTVGETRKIDTGYGGLYVTINEDASGPFEVFATVGKSGGFTESMTEGLARMISLALRSGIPAEHVVEQLSGIRSPRTNWDGGETVESVPDGIAIALNRHIDQQASGEIKIDATGVTNAEPVTQSVEADGGDVQEIIDTGANPECPECGGLLAMQEGCKTCPSCGWSRC